MDMDMDIEDLAKMYSADNETIVSNNGTGNKDTKTNHTSATLLEHYYRSLFPFKLFYRWLGEDSCDLFERREFSFTLENDIYVRFQSFSSDAEFKKEVMRGLPVKIDIGAIYNTQPRYHLSTSGKGFLPLQKEMVFDIDMTDYDDVRTCCKDAKMCDKCWKFMVVAYRILNAILRDDFGFEKVLWVFSGRRGIHCWVSDTRAKNLTNDGRGALAGFIKYRTVNINSGIKSVLREPIHPSLERSLGLIEEVFEEFILKGQDILNDPRIVHLIVMIVKAHFSSAASNVDEKLATVFSYKGDSVGKWKSLQTLLVSYELPKKTGKYTMTELCLKEVKLNIAYPRLDINVSKHINHLLKSPFCVHPKTGLISVPLSEADIENFKLDEIPSISESVDDEMNNRSGKLGHFIKNFEQSL